MVSTGLIWSKCQAESHLSAAKLLQGPALGEGDILQEVVIASPSQVPMLYTVRGRVYFSDAHVHIHRVDGSSLLRNASLGSHHEDQDR